MKKKLIACMICLVIFLTSCGSIVTTSVEELASIDVVGEDGSGSLSVRLDTEKRDEIIQSYFHDKEEILLDVDDFFRSIEFVVIPMNRNLSNGDTVKILMDYSPDKAKNAKIKVKDIELIYQIDGLHAK